MSNASKCDRIYAELVAQKKVYERINAELLVQKEAHERIKDLIDEEICRIGFEIEQLAKQKGDCDGGR